MNCPVCGARMRQIRHGPVLRKKGPGYVCPVAEAEFFTRYDARGHLQRRRGALHPWLRVWSEEEVRAVMRPRGCLDEDPKEGQ